MPEGRLRRLHEQAGPPRGAGGGFQGGGGLADQHVTGGLWAPGLDHLARGSCLEEDDDDDDQAAKHHHAAEYLRVKTVRLRDDLDHRRAEHQDVAQAEQPDSMRDPFVLTTAPWPLSNY